MNMIYNSQNYCVVEFGAFGERTGGAFEIVDKTTQREIFLEGLSADTFRQGVAELIATEPSTEDVDEFLSGFDLMMQQPVTLH